jgi:spermidine dehydrogenase
VNEKNSDDLGLGQRIDRRDFISGVAASAVFLSAGRAVAQQAGGAQSAPAAATSDEWAGSVPSPEQYPPVATGLRGQYPGSFEVAHGARDGQFSGDISAEDSGEHYDLVVVGGGISGLATAHFFRKALGDERKILILDNHDDFGGHAKRNEFHHNGRMYVGYGGTMSIETPFPYSYTAKALIAELGIDVSSYERHEKHEVYQGLGRGIFFDREHFAGDRVVAGVGQRPWEEFFASAPLSPRVRADLIRVHTANIDYMADVDPVQKAEALRRMSYQDFLLKHAKILPESLPFFTGSGFRNNMRVDTCPAYTAARSGAVGFKGMKLPDDPPFHSDYEFHFPDGNASIARLLVSRLVPGVFGSAQTQESIVTARANYDALDVAANPTRIRLKSTVVRVAHVGQPTKTDRVRVVYVRDGKPIQVTGGNVVMACFNNIIRFIVPTLPEEQKQALAYASKVPMQYTNVLVRNWEPWKKLGVSGIQAPNGYHTSVSLDIPVSIGRYECPTDPGQPIVVHMVRNPNHPGVPRKEQHRLGRADMLATPFSKIEMEIRSQLQRMLGPAGFDSKKDILAITVNRWPHGYAYTYDTLGDPDLPEADRPHVIGRKMFGRIAIANSDSSAAAFTNTAIDMANRAVQECLSSRGLV